MNKSDWMECLLSLRDVTAPRETRNPKTANGYRRDAPITGRDPLNPALERAEVKHSQPCRRGDRPPDFSFDYPATPFVTT